MEPGVGWCGAVCDGSRGSEHSWVTGKVITESCLLSGVRTAGMLPAFEKLPAEIKGEDLAYIWRSEARHSLIHTLSTDSNTAAIAGNNHQPFPECPFVSLPTFIAAFPAAAASLGL